VTREDLDVDDLASIEHGQVHRLVCQLIEILHIRQRSVTETLLLWHSLAEFEHPDAKPPSALGALERTMRGELNRKTVCCGARESASLGEFIETQLTDPVAERGKEPERSTDYSLAARVAHFIDPTDWNTGLSHSVGC
jgi:hypothetical protein